MNLHHSRLWLARSCKLAKTRLTVRLAASASSAGLAGYQFGIMLQAKILPIS